MGALHGLGLEAHGLEVVELAVVLHDVFGPQPPADQHRLVEAPPACARVELGGAPLALEPPSPHTELGPTARGDVEGLHGTRGHERMAEPQQVDVCAEPDARRATGEVTEKAERVDDRRVGREGRVLLAHIR